MRTAVGLSMDVQTQKAALSSDAASQFTAHGRRGKRRSKHFTQFLTCRTTQQKVQGSTHNARSAYSSRLRKHPQLLLAAELARHPAAPGLLFTAAAVQGFSVASKITSSVVDKGSVGAETLGTAISKQLQQASNSITIQTEASQNSFQEWKGLMNGIMSEEASRVQAELDRASKTAAMWQQQSSETQVKISELQSGWLVDALQERFPQAGSASAWPTSFFVTAGSDSSSDSMSFSDDEDRKAASSPTFVSRFTDQAKDLTTQLPIAARSRAAALDRNMTEFGSVASDLMASVISQAEQLPDVARSRTATLHRNMSGVRSVASDLMASVISQAEQLPDVARSRGAALDRTMSGVRSAGSDFVTSVMSKAAEFPGQHFGVSSFSSSSPERASSKIGQTGRSYGRQLSGPASFTASLPSPDKAGSHPTASAASTAAVPPASASSTAASVPSPDRVAAVLPTASASSQAEALPSASPTQPASPHMASPTQRVAPPKGAASPSKLSPRKAKTKPSAGLPLVKTANSRQSVPLSPTSSSEQPFPAKLPGQALTNGSTSSTAKPEDFPSQPPQPSALANAPARTRFTARNVLTACSGAKQPSATPAASSASAVAGRAAVLASDESGVPAGSSSPVAAAEAQESLRRASGNAQPSAETAGATAQVPFTAAAGGQGPSTASAKSACPPVSATRDTHQADEGMSQGKGGVPQAKGYAGQAKGDTFEAEGGGAQHLASATGDDTRPEQQALSSTAQSPIGDRTTAVPQGADQLHKQPKAKTQLKRVRVVRPVPTPNWRAPRPLSPPPTPVQQGHPLSAPPAQGAYAQTASGQQGSPIVDSSGQSLDNAAASAASAGLPSDSPASDGVEAIRPSSVRRNASATQTLGHDAAKPDSPQPIAASSSSVAEHAEHAEQSRSPRQHPNTTAAAATTAVESETTTTVIDDIAWGTSGTGTTRGSQMSPQTGGGGGSSTGGTTGGGGGGRHRPSGDNGGSDGGHRSSSTWRQWWLGLLLLSGGATAVSMSSAIRAACMNAMAAIKAKLAPAKREEQQQDEEEVQQEDKDEEQPQSNVPAEFNARIKDSIATNIKVNEGDTAWSIAEEYSGGGTAWPEVVSSNPHADTAKPTSGMTLRVSVRM